MTTITATTFANCFVTTFKVGNEQGYSVGKRFDLTDYKNKADFIGAAIDYAKSELGDNDPELAFPDYETSFDSLDLINEGGIDDKVWEVLGLENRTREIMMAFLENCEMIDNDIVKTANYAKCSWIGQWECEHDFARNQLDRRGLLDIMPVEVMDNLNLTACANQFATNMMVSDDGHYFTNW